MSTPELNDISEKLKESPSVKKLAELTKQCRQRGREEQFFSFSDVRFEDEKFLGDWPASVRTIKNSNFIRCKILESEFTNIDLHDCVFIDCFFGSTDENYLVHDAKSVSSRFLAWITTSPKRLIAWFKISRKQVVSELMPIPPGSSQTIWTDLRNTRFLRCQFTSVTFGHVIVDRTTHFINTLEIDNTSIARTSLLELPQDVEHGLTRSDIGKLTIRDYLHNNLVPRFSGVRYWLYLASAAIWIAPLIVFIILGLTIGQVGDGKSTSMPMWNAITIFLSSPHDTPDSVLGDIFNRPSIVMILFVLSGIYHLSRLYLMYVVEIMLAKENRTGCPALLTLDDRPVIKYVLLINKILCLFYLLSFLWSVWYLANFPVNWVMVSKFYTP